MYPEYLPIMYPEICWIIGLKEEENVYVPLKNIDGFSYKIGIEIVQ
jgi:hypothetical protein